MIPLSHCRIAQPVPLWLVPLKSGPGRGLSSMDCLGLGNAPAQARQCPSERPRTITAVWY